MKKLIKFICLILILSTLIGFLPSVENKVFATSLIDDIDVYIENLSNFEKKYAYEETNIVLNFDNLQISQNGNYIIELDDFISITNSKQSNHNGDKLVTYNEDAVIVFNNDDSEFESFDNVSVVNNSPKVAKIQKVDISNIPTDSHFTNISTFKSEISSYDILNEEEQIFVDVEEISNALGFGVKETKDELILTRSFESKQLIVIYEGDNFNSRGAVEFINYNRLYICQYTSEKETKRVFEEYLLDDAILMVTPNASMSAFEDLSTSFENTINENPTTSKTFASWGASSMGIDSYSNLIENYYKEENLEKVIVAVLDTGIDTDHEWFNDKNGSSKINFTYAKDFTNNTFGYEDGHGHGTHVSGTITELNFDNVEILPLKVLGDNGKGSGTYSAIEYVRTLRKSGVNIVAINMSLGAFLDPNEYSESYLEYIRSYHQEKYGNYFNDLISYDIAPIVAAGNEETNLDIYKNVYPACVDSAITVSALQNGTSLNFASYSNYGTFVDFSAPGSSIKSAKVGGGTCYKSGTSMATPHVAGAYALIKSVYPNKQVNEIVEILKENAIDLGDTGKDDYYGNGLVNISGLIKNINLDYTNSNVEINGVDLDSLNNNFLVSKNKDLKFRVSASQGYTISSIRIENGNDVINLSELEIISTQNEGYTITNIENDISIYIEAVINSCRVTVNQPSNGGRINLDSKDYGYNTLLEFDISIDIGYSFNQLLIKNNDNEDVVFEQTENGYKVIVKEDIIISLIVSPNNNTMYTVNYYYQDINLEYILKESNILYGTTNTLTKATANDLSGFNIKNFNNEIIKGDGSTTIDIYYDRNLYKLDIIGIQNTNEIIIEILNGKNSNQENYYYFEQAVSIKLTMAYGYNLSSISGETDGFNYISTSLNSELYMPSKDITLKVNSTLKKYLIQTSKKGNGDISSSQEVEHFSNYKVEFSPMEHYHIKSVTVDGQLKPEAITNGYFDFEEITSNHIISVVFEIDKINITASVSNDNYGYLYPHGNLTLAYGSNVNFEFYSNYGYKISKILVDNQEVDNNINSYLFENVESNKTLYIEFEPLTFNVNFKQPASSHGTIECINDYENVNFGESRTFKITPDNGYVVEKVFVNGIAVNCINNVFSINNIEEDYNVNIIYNNVKTNELFENNYQLLIIGILIIIGLILIVTPIIIIVKHKKVTDNSEYKNKNDKNYDNEVSIVKNETSSHVDTLDKGDNDIEEKITKNTNPFLNNSRFNKQ